ncbi:ATP-dependent helicase/DNAse subunit B [Salsuginibacillus halophilus]|uniref:ATP-dependent helicase/DNAse subunit B n=1 Tax=Salsuginibacillus halophilus TaxID=517424 RepID=A0A2P8HWN2_9BACI|nr:PD-(D/E)XK nuclease family protein [Salsuginibacillus halophilus]PSL50608.1 ATP-dependent helicase/DNAse subunit B [Salsuginibacillus halophilus]
MDDAMLKQLQEVCEAYPIEPVWLVVPSTRDGRLIMKTLAENGISLLNVKVVTMDQLADAAVGGDTASKRMDRNGIHRRLYQALKASKQELNYFTNITISPNFIDQMMTTLLDIKRAGLNASKMSEETFVHPDKARDLAKLERVYETIKHSLEAFDEADILKKAVSSVERTFLPSAVVFFPHDAYHKLERELLLTVKDYIPVYTAAPESSADAPMPNQPLSFLEKEVPSLERGLKQKQANLSMHEAFSLDEEVRAMLETMRQNVDAFDEVVIHYTSTKDYLPLLHESVTSMGLPATFAEGIPLHHTKHGRAFFALVQWLQNDMKLPDLRDYMQEGLFSWPDVAVQEAEVRLLELENRGVQVLNEYALQQLYETAEYSGRATDLALFTRFKQVLDCVPVKYRYDELDLGTAANHLKRMLQVIQPDFAGEEAVVHEALQTHLEAVEICLDENYAWMDILQLIDHECRKLYAGGSLPKPGRLHITPYRNGLYINRSHHWVLGMDQTRYPGRQSEDPLLLDGERASLNSELDLSTYHTSRALWQLASIFLNGNNRSFYVSYASMDLGKNRPQVKAHLYQALEDALAKNITIHKPYRPLDVKFDQVDWWHDKAHLGAGHRFAREAASFYTMHHQLIEAATQRFSSKWTPWDGVLKDPAALVDPKRESVPFSASKLETLASCPFAYYLSYVLKLDPEEDRSEEYRWLTPLERGSVLHELYEDIVRLGLINMEENLSQVKLDELFIEKMSSLEERIPPASLTARDIERRELYASSQLFLNVEKQKPAHQAISTEYRFGFVDHPTAIPTENGESIQIRGKIDRVNQYEDQSIEIVDYKTGRAQKFKDSSYFEGGRRLQPALYAAAYEQNEKQKVRQTGYDYPTTKGLGASVRFSYGEKEQVKLSEVLERLSRTAATGRFYLTDDPEDCKFCRFQDVCRRTHYDQELIEQKQDVDQPEIYRGFQEVRKYD